MKQARPLHERVKSHVEESGLELADIAKQGGWEEQNLYRRLVGKTKFSGEDIEKLARILNKPVAALYRGRAA